MNCGFWSCASVSKPLEEPPFAPPEGDYGDETERETMTDRMYRQGKMGYVSGVHGELVGMQGATLVVGDDHFGGAPNCPNKSIGGLLIQDSNQKHSDACT